MCRTEGIYKGVYTGTSHSEICASVCMCVRMCLGCSAGWKLEQFKESFLKKINFDLSSKDE